MYQGFRQDKSYLDSYSLVQVNVIEASRLVVPFHSLKHRASCYKFLIVLVVLSPARLAYRNRKRPVSHKTPLEYEMLIGNLERDAPKRSIF